MVLELLHFMNQNTLITRIYSICYLESPEHYVFFPLSYSCRPLSNLAFNVILGFILKTMSFGMSGWACIDAGNIYLLSASKVMVSLVCGAFPHSQTHIASSPCHCPVPYTNHPSEILSTQRPIAHVCAFRISRCLDIFHKLKSATYPRDAIVHHKFPMKIFVMSYL